MRSITPARPTTYLMNLMTRPSVRKLDYLSLRKRTTIDQTYTKNINIKTTRTSHSDRSIKNLSRQVPIGHRPNIKVPSIRSYAKRACTTRHLISDRKYQMSLPLPNGPVYANVNYPTKMLRCTTNKISNWLNSLWISKWFIKNTNIIPKKKVYRNRLAGHSSTKRQTIPNRTLVRQ